MPTNKYFACPFCTERLTREDMVTHIERKHEAELPEGFTPLRATFHAVNRKDMKYRRPCRICRKPTEWDENKGRYNFLCENPNCKKLWIDNMKETMGEKYGAFRPTTSVEGLEKMLAARKISGKYKFSTGGEVPYTGSYEKKALEFMDHVLGVKFEDVEVPGPSIKYPYKGEDHIYIPDIYYRPYNLIIEVKDGGKNPNTHPGFSDVRARKIAKEKHVINNTKYNYLRLTDNNFGQLLAVFADLKFHLVNDDRNKVSHVNEAAELAANTIKEHMGIASVAPMVGFTPGDAVILTKPMNRVFAVTDSPYFEKVVTLNHKGMLGYMDKDEFGDNYKMYVKKDCMPNIDKALKNFIGKELSESAFYELVFGHPQYSSDQILFEDMICYSDMMDKIYEDLIDTTMELVGFNEKMEEFKAGGFDQYKSTFFSENDMKYNYDAFVKGSTDILFITGISAKGKADYAEDIANQYGADVIHLDDVEHNKRYSDKKLREKHILIYKYFCDTEEGVESREKKKKDPEVDLYETVPNFLQFFLANRDPHKRYIVVGSQLMDLLAAGRISFDILEKYAIILKDASVIQTKSQVDDIQSKDKIFELMDDYVDYMKNKVKKTSYENLPKNLKKKVDNDKPLDDIVKDVLGEAADFVPKDLLNQMKSFKYKNFDKLMSWEEVENSQSGSCHDQVMYELHELKKLCLEPKALFLIELKEGQEQGGRTHSLVYYKEGNKIYWFENAWESQIGIHGPYDSLKDLKKDIERKMLSESNYDFVEFGAFKGIPGMTLQELVDACLDEPEEIDKDTLSEACKDLSAARKFASEVKDLAKKYDANFYLVTDGASATNNDGSNDAVKHARDTMKKWETKHGFDAKEDWAKDAFKESVDKSTIDNNHSTHKISGIKYIDANSPEGLKYLKKYENEKLYSNMKEYWIDKKKANAILAIDTKKELLAGYICVKSNGDIQPVYVYPDYRGSGISTELCKQAIDKLGANKLGVYSDNQIAIHLYDSLGFKEYDKKKYKDGTEVIKMKLNEMLEESTVNESITEAASIISNLYFVSQSDPEKLGDTLKPRIPNNFLTKNGYEDNTTPRVCFSNSINGCLIALSQNLKGKEFYVYIPTKKYKFYSPRTNEVPDARVTGEKWITEDVKIKCIGKIKVTEVIDSPLPYTYGNNKKADLYAWDWEWVEQYDSENIINEATDISKPVISEPYFIKSSDGVDNACVDIQGYDHPCRGRSSMLILKFEDGEWKVFLSKDEEKDHEYHAPGGGWNKGESPKDAAIREAQEEVYINVKDVKYEGFLIEYHEEVAEWVKDHVSDSSKWWYGYYSEIFVGMYDSKFTGEVKDIDKDQMANSGKWYNFEDIKDDLTPVEYKEAIESYIEEASNPSYVNENTLFNAKDIYHNKDKFDSGEINLCFITGHGGSGKSTMGRGMGTDVQHYELDDVTQNWNFSDENLKEYGNLIYTFFKTIGKKFRYTSEEDFEKGNNPLDNTGDNYDKELVNAFVNYAKAYANSHKNEKFVVEGIQLFLFIPPESIKDYAVYIKGTSAVVSAYRAAKRDTETDGLKGLEKVKGMAKMLTNKKTNKYRMEDEKLINKYRNYFKEDTDMTSYTQVLEFFMKNGIQLDSEQIENLKDICEDGYSLDTFYCTEDDTIDLTSDLLPVLEITEEDLKKNMDLSPVFVMLSFNGGLVGKVIKGYGKDLGWEYSHSSISLLPSLSTLYSFNITKSTDEEGKKHKYNGLAIEHFRDFRDNPKCKIKVIAILVDTETRNKIKKAIQYYIDNIDKTKYATGSLAKALMGTGEKIQNYGNMTLFCSQFVDAVLKQANIDIGGRGSSVNTHPSELGQFKDKNNYFTVYEGPASGYDEEKINQKITYMKQTMDYKDLNAITDRTGTIDVNDHRVENRAKQYIERKIQKAKDNKAARKEKPIPLDKPLEA